MPERAAIQGELPLPSAEIILWRVSIQAFIAVSGRRKAERFLRAMSEQLADENALTSVLPIQPSPHDAAIRRARREAAEAFSRYLPMFVAQMRD